MNKSQLPSGISVVVPVFDSEGSLEKLVTQLEDVMKTIGPEFELILVNDCSRDGSWAVVRNLARSHKWVWGIDLMRNYGQHNALLCGIRAARYATIVTMDDDLQNPPAEIPKLLAKLSEGHDVVYGKPRQEQHGLFRDAASQVTKLVLQKAMGAETARSISAFRAFRTVLRQAFVDYQNPLVSIDVLLTWGTTRFAAIEVQHDPRQYGRSNYTVGRLILHATNMVTGFTVWPLRVASTIGFAFTLFGIGVLVYVVGRYLIQGSAVQGFPFLASVTSILAGAQLFAIGILGEYLARIHQRSIARPAYTVASKTREEEPEHRHVSAM